MINKALLVIYVVYCLQVGVFLLIFPWLRFWEHNSLLAHYPELKIVFLNNFFRGAVSGLGVVNLLLGVLEVAQFQRYSRKA